MNDITKKHFEDFNQRLAIQNKYTLKRLPDGKVWIIENIQEEVEGAYWSERHNCSFYTWQQAQEIVIPGFHIPTEEEFCGLCDAVGYGQGDNQKAIQRLRQECGFTPAGFVTSCSNPSYEYGPQDISYHWTTSSRDTKSVFCFRCDNLFMGCTDLGIRRKDMGLTVRLVQD